MPSVTQLVEQLGVFKGRRSRAHVHVHVHVLVDVHVFVSVLVPVQHILESIDTQTRRREPPASGAIRAGSAPLIVPQSKQFQSINPSSDTINRTHV